jgi:2-polyprenyl-3-methyl-5-hydroxy-6-metoxy-1,4-benzoquinol methylase
MNVPLVPSVTLEDRDCPLGCARDDDFILKGRDRLNNLPGDFTVVRCRACGLLRTNPRPTLETMGYYYPEQYSPFEGTKIREVTSPVQYPRLKKLTQRIFKFNTIILPPQPPGRMLEAGCASGSFLHYMAHRGWEVEGVEPSKAAAQNARHMGYKVFEGSIELKPDTADLFDLIVGWMVLEHLHEPVVVLRKFQAWLKPGGWLVLSVPDAGGMEFGLFKNKWYDLHLPNHLYHFTAQTIRLILRKTGWNVQKIFHQRILTNLVASLGYFLSARILSDWKQTGRMTVWARKAHD